MIAAGRRHPSLLWGAATPLVVLVAACLPLLVTRDFYFWDDTEISGFPLWFDLGEKLRAGEWPILEPSRWMGGNIVAEGQWGLWNPMMLAVSLAARFAGNALTFTTGVKLLFFMVAALGVFLLARSYDVRPPLAFAAGVAVPLNGFTLYMDAPVVGGWDDHLVPAAVRLGGASAQHRQGLASSRLPRRRLPARDHRLYFHGTLPLCLVLLAVGIDRLWARDWRGVRCAVLGAAFVGLISVTLYLPSLLTTDVTVRTQERWSTSARSTRTWVDCSPPGSPPPCSPWAGGGGLHDHAPALHGVVPPGAGVRALGARTSPSARDARPAHRVAGCDAGRDGPQ